MTYLAVYIIGAVIGMFMVAYVSIKNPQDDLTILFMMIIVWPLIVPLLIPALIILWTWKTVLTILAIFIKGEDGE